jgi:hypothetical protein
MYIRRLHVTDEYTRQLAPPYAADMCSICFSVIRCLVKRGTYWGVCVYIYTHTQHDYSQHMLSEHMS